MKTNSELKNRAIDALTGNWGLGAVITLVYGLVMNAPTLPYRCLLYTSPSPRDCS